LIRVYSGEGVGETLDVEGAPQARDVGLANALVDGAVVLAVLYILLRGQRDRGEGDKKLPAAGR
jgi:hypothetical protein